MFHGLQQRRRRAVMCSGVRLAAVELAEFPVKKNMSCDHVNT